MNQTLNAGIKMKFHKTQNNTVLCYFRSKSVKSALEHPFYQRAILRYFQNNNP